MKKILLSVVMIGFASVVNAQAKAPTLTETESLKVENLNLKYQAAQNQIEAIQREMKDLAEQYKALSATIEKEHPGYKLQGTQLVEEPKPKK